MTETDRTDMPVEEGYGAGSSRAKKASAARRDSTASTASTGCVCVGGGETDKYLDASIHVYMSCVLTCETMATKFGHFFFGVSGILCAQYSINL